MFTATNIIPSSGTIVVKFNDPAKYYPLAGCTNANDDSITNALVPYTLPSHSISC